MTKIIRSSKIKPKFANTSKLEVLQILFNDAIETQCVRMINKMIYSSETVQALPNKYWQEQFPYKGRIGQLLLKECSSIARSIKKKVKKANNYHNKKKYQDEILTKFKEKTLFVNKISQLNLDSRFVKIEQSTDTSFDYWLIIKFPTLPKISIPFNITKHMLDLESRNFHMKVDTLRIRKNGLIELTYQKEQTKSSGKEEIGIDVGQHKSFICSNGTMENISKDKLNRLKYKKHGSKSKRGNVVDYKQTIDKQIKQLIEFDKLKTIYLEKLDDMKRSSKRGNRSHHWSHRYITNRIALHAEEHGVHVHYVHSSYTSQTCSKCNHKDKKNRQNEDFNCLSCGLSIDADLNASINILKRGSHRLHDEKT